MWSNLFRVFGEERVLMLHGLVFLVLQKVLYKSLIGRAWTPNSLPLSRPSLQHLHRPLSCERFFHNKCGKSRCSSPQPFPRTVLELSNAGDTSLFTFVPECSLGHCNPVSTQLLNTCCQQDPIFGGPRLMEEAGPIEWVSM